MNPRAACIAIALVLASSAPTASADVDRVDSSCTKIDRGYRCLYGPIDVGYGHNEILQQVAAPGPGYIKRARATVVDENGREIAHHRAHLHHALWFNTTEDSRTCFSQTQGVYGTGAESTLMKLPRGYGYLWSNRSRDGARLDEDDRPWRLDADLMGMHRDDPATAYIRLNLRMAPTRSGLRRVQPLWWSAKGCHPDTTFDVAKGSGSDGRYTRSATYQMPFRGRFVYGWGHVHDGGIRMALDNVTDGRRIFVSRALYRGDSRWELTGATSFSSRRGIAVDKGDRLKVTVVYDSRHTWKNVMGNLRAFVFRP